LAVTYPINQNSGKSLWVSSLNRAITKDSRNRKQNHGKMKPWITQKIYKPQRATRNKGERKMEMPTLSEEEKWEMMREMFVLNIKKGLLPITKEEFQRGCIEGYFKPRAEKLGLELDVEYTDEGYGIKISKK
jgi:hypothetical protein